MKLYYILFFIWLMSSTVICASLEDIKGQLENEIWEELSLRDQRIHHEPEEPMMMLIDAAMEMSLLDKYYVEDVLAGDEHYLPQPETIGQESVPNPTGKQRFHFNPNRHSTARLAIGHHTFCGPYTQHYTNQQCIPVGDTRHDPKLHGEHGISVQECEDLCKANANCNAITWSEKIGLGCFLQDCQKGKRGPPPMPRGDNPDFVSFSQYKPDAIERCVKSSGSYDTDLNFCGPYHYDYLDKQCQHLRNIYHNPDDLYAPIECETFCMRNPSCTAFSHSPKPQHGCVLRDCGGHPPLPNGTNTDWLSYTKTRPLHASNCH